MYIGIDIQKNVQSRNWYILHTYVRTQYKSKILHTVGIDIVQGNKMGLQYYTQDMSRIPLKYHTNVLFYTKYTHPALICRGTHGRTDGRMHGRTENIYSIFRDKLLLLGEHV